MSRSHGPAESSCDSVKQRFLRLFESLDCHLARDGREPVEELSQGIAALKASGSTTIIRSAVIAEMVPSARRPNTGSRLFPADALVQIPGPNSARERELGLTAGT